MNTLDHILLKEIGKHRTPSVQYLIFNQNDVIYKFQMGFGDLQNRKSVDDYTTYHVFSITKTFTALAILQLAEHGKLNIDEPIANHLPELPYPGAITIRQLLTHSGGIPNPMPLRWIHLTTESETFDSKLFFDQIFARYNKVQSMPNHKFAYSNLGYVILGRIIEKVSGTSYEKFITNHILTTLNLQPTEMGFIIPDFGRNAKGYHNRFSVSYLLLSLLIDKTKYMGKAEGQWKVFHDFYVNGISYGGLIGTPGAFVKYVQEFLKPASGLLGEEHKKLLFTENITTAGKSTGMCMSWFKGNLNGLEYFTHAGGGGGYYSEIRVYPGINLGSLIMFNRTGMTDERFLDKVDKYFLEPTMRK